MTNLLDSKPDRKQSVGERIVEHLQKVAAAVSEADKKLADEFVCRAKEAAVQPRMDIVVHTPGSSALMVLYHNNYGRAWSPEWSDQIARTMKDGEWRENTPQGYAFFGDNGDVADGVHRLTAQAYAGVTLSVPTYFGMSKKDVAVLDCGRTRTGADAAALSGVTNAREKEALLKYIFGYEKSAGIPGNRMLQQPSALCQQIIANDAVLSRALEVGRVSIEETSDPLLAPKEAAKIAGLLLRHHWPDSRVMERLEELQGAEFANDKAPLCIARQYIENHRKPVDTITASREIGMLVQALKLEEAGFSAREQDITSAGKTFPNPEYPSGSKHRAVA